MYHQILSLLQIEFEPHISNQQVCALPCGLFRLSEKLIILVRASHQNQV